MMKKKPLITILIITAMFAMALVVSWAIIPSRKIVENDMTEKSNSTIGETENEIHTEIAGVEEYEENAENGQLDDIEITPEDIEDNLEIVGTLTFVDVFGEEYQTEILRDVPKTDLDNEKYVHDGEKLLYEDDSYRSRLGVDVSHHQGYIDWKKVKASGYDFAFIRLGYRGYGQSGSVNLDKTFDANIKNAQDAGIEVGVYFFAQAINEDEAKEEAEFVIKHLEDYDVELPVVYDPESILDAEARTDNVSGEQFTKNALVFCSLIEDAGYEPMIYSNMLWEAFQFDMTKVCKYQFWYADYELEPQTPYRYKYWQYTNGGHVDGISGRVDLNIELIER